MGLVIPKNVLTGGVGYHTNETARFPLPPQNGSHFRETGRRVSHHIIQPDFILPVQLRLGKTEVPDAHVSKALLKGPEGEIPERHGLSGAEHLQGLQKRRDN